MLKKLKIYFKIQKFLKLNLTPKIFEKKSLSLKNNLFFINL